MILRCSILMASLCFVQILLAQIKWKNDSVPFSDIEWNNYSTTYIGNNFDTVPLIVTAIPYNGVYSIYNAPLSMSFEGSDFAFQSNLSNYKQQLVTYDSGSVYFLTPGIFKSNSLLYQFRVFKDSNEIIRPWSTITTFTDDSFQINSFKKHCGYLGGYKTSWNHYLTVELRRKKDSQIIASTYVVWGQTKPVIFNIYTSSDLNEFLKQLNRPWDRTLDSIDKDKWKRYDSANGLNVTGTLPEKLMLEPDESSVIFFINALIYKRDALEYSLIKDGETLLDWKANDFDNNFVWLQKLSHGDYVLQMRYSKQRQNITSYPFRIKAYWYQTTFFHFAVGFLAGLMMIFLIYFVVNKRRLTREKRKREQLQLEQRSVRSQLNPHFTFNALSSIQSLMNQNKIKEANYYFTEFSSLLRDSLHNNEKEWLPLQTELQTLERYIRLEQLRFHFQYRIFVAKNINVSTTEIPSLLLQPLVENAIKHGVSRLQKEGIIGVDVTTENNHLLIKIQDNGNGFSPADEGKGYGLSLTKDRIRLMNQNLSKQKTEIAIDSDLSGTIVTLHFQNWL